MNPDDKYSVFSYRDVGFSKHVIKCVLGYSYTALMLKPGPYFCL